MKRRTFEGVFKNEFEKYITYKQSLGYYRNLESKKIYELVSLNNFLNSFNLSEIKITKEMVDIYLETNSSLSQGTQHSKECVLRQFCKFLKSQGMKIFIFLTKLRLKCLEILYLMFFLMMR